MTTQTALEQILQRIVLENDPAVRQTLADAYAAELRVILRTVSDRAMQTVWSEKDDILEQIGDTNTLVSRLLTVLENHNDESRVYRAGVVQELHAVNVKLDTYISALPHEERMRLVEQIKNHEARLTALEQDDAK